MREPRDDRRAGGSDRDGDRATDASGDVTEVPDETGGPYPGDGSNGVNVLDDSGIVRSDIRSSFGASTTTAEGVPLDDPADGPGCCDRRRAVRCGRLPVALRPRRRVLALQRRGWRTRTTSAACRRSTPAGTVTFTSIFPAAYSGRWPHIHFEVYSDVADRGGDRTDREDVADRAAQGGLRRGVRDDRLRAERAEPGADEPRVRTTCSATTAASTRSRACRARSPPATRRR